ncbi:hypothetical protein CPAST_c22770 [Clostridium pasteurianum DSM 525 = ATCC 6013]|uniref:Dehydratase medium subunit n=2 Tax=Clostridium pasteurianum DSM 525 = ATCC 6013 TaxID=1262449 RepID=A0A0H3J5A2_CLOPA|nr:glycerol dehydratase reactivase beta/small subunit family protein [Clostridium pasteurianum]AJA48347.1 hypothetical protein CPAST_c22770 [Clostridium pasteurianum DSM 525 = ATCC 6013]AJA52335.1 hypothetical protein CLPA_c22770 [Clostridium pasteurianum DSM 525 = ATCC 6013]ELP60503.1 hypothetical protein F502_03422 [Clostridium pasteurianum DSM 525 = ATCC 6013]KRU11655.1 dehydratase medium subunit [Clostridium pasteurianum DSM 525 = ATCC 6013]OMH22224.1 hypothetical protein AC231_00405 [Clos
MKEKFNINKPTINVYFNPNIKDKNILNNILLGMEEESIPYKIEENSEKDSVKLGYIAAKNSKLEVGIGIGTDNIIVIHYSKLTLNNPLFKVKITDTKKNIRFIGANAARLVKKNPFKNMDFMY